jgi:AraC-like DNA-binding protein
MSNTIQFLQPSGILRNCIQNYYMGELTGLSDRQEFEQKPISNGCVELFIGYQNTQTTCYTNTGGAIRTQSAIVGAHNLQNNIRGMDMEPESKMLKFVSINFTINGFYDIFKIPSSELYNGFFETYHVIGCDFIQLQEQLDDSIHNNSRKQILDQFLLKQMNRNNHKSYNIKAGFNIANFINECKGDVRVNKLMNDLKVSERTLQRNIKQALGLSLKEYCKIIRFENLFTFINTHPAINWSDIAFQFGYYDQAHMIKEFKSATGITPALFVKHKYKNMFKLGNHIVILKTEAICNEIQIAISQGEESYLKNFPAEF